MNDPVRRAHEFIARLLRNNEGRGGLLVWIDWRFRQWTHRPAATEFTVSYWGCRPSIPQQTAQVSGSTRFAFARHGPECAATASQILATASYSLAKSVRQISKSAPIIISVPPNAKSPENALSSVSVFSMALQIFPGNRLLGDRLVSCYGARLHRDPLLPACIGSR